LCVGDKFLISAFASVFTSLSVDQRNSREKVPKCRGLKTSGEKCIRWSGTDLRYDPFTSRRCSCVMG